MIKISFCIVNLNAKEVLKECLISINNSMSGEEYEIIITDNNSTDGSQKMINSLDRNIHIIQNKNNKKLLSRLSNSKKVRTQIVQLKQDIAKPDFGRE